MLSHNNRSWQMGAMTQLRLAKNWWIQRLQQAPLRLALVVPFALQICLAVSLAGYFSFLNGQQAVGELANQLLEEVGDRVVLRLDSYLQTPHLLNQLNADGVQSGELDLNDLNTLQRRLFLQHQQFKSITSLAIANPQGEFRTILRVDPQADPARYRLGPVQISVADVTDRNQVRVYKPDSQGNSVQFLKILPNFDVRNRPWYRDAIRTGEAGWTEVDQIGRTHLLGISAYQPVYKPDSDDLLGVFSANVSLSEIGKFLATLKVGKSGEVFILERNGLQLANSIQELPYKASTQDQNTVAFQRLPVEESDSPLVKNASRYLKKQFGSFAAMQSQQRLRFTIDGEAQFLLVLPYRDEMGIDWLIVVVAPEADFLGQIQENTRTTVLVCLGAAIGAIALGVFTSQWITRPILRLSLASQRVANGELNAIVPAKGMRELNVMAKSFNQMLREIRYSRQQLQDYSKLLEQRVSQRTQELQQEIAERISTQQALQRANQELEKLAYVDGLTQVSNRRHFDQVLEREWGRLTREQASLSLILCDADFFKRYNDRYGHQAGDYCLQQIAKAIDRSVKRPGDMVARYGGEEFVAILPLTSAEGAMRVAQEIQAAVHQLQLLHEDSAVSQFVTVSLGVATVVPTLKQSPADLIAAADQALYEAKAAGRDRIISTKLDPRMIADDLIESA
ncbi:diguanylate cyclase [Phormidium tenue FACHB-886]|nr:diguanylate cyclase [Phormidium tenue FACHB-886]